MKSLFKFKQAPQPFLAPLGSRPRLPRFPRPSREVLSNLPASAAPIAVTLVGGLALIVLLGTFLGREAGESHDQAAPLSSGAVATEQPAAQAGTTADAPGNTEENPAAEATARATVPSVESAPQLLEPAALAEGGTFQPDPGRTSSILAARPAASAFVPSVPVAESEDEVAQLEAIQRREVEADVGVPSEEETASIGPIGTSSMQQATTTRYVNMRSGPADDAEVLLVVPALEKIEAETDCDWCSVRYDGRTGYIYKTFLSYE
ncbi:MAG: hypothetical protein KL840_22185 [Aquamicrobium sp.]|nr:hypothetical protein [Aquamicrobium sp.]